MIGRLLSNYQLAAQCDYPSNQMACCGLLYLHQVTCSGIVNDFSYKTRDDIRSPLLNAYVPNDVPQMEKSSQLQKFLEYSVN